MERSIRYDLFTENAFSARELNLEKILVYHNDKRNTPRMLAGLSAGRSTPLDYLRLIESHIPEKLISDEQFNEIKNISQMLSGGFTSFFGFETRLSDPGAHSDYLLAISSRKGEREQLMNLMQSEFFKHFQHSPQWQHISKFTEQWTNQDSIIHEKVLGLWFEFDSNDFSSTIPIPNVFLQTTPIQLKTPEDIKHCLWITKEALPLITGHQLPLTIQHKVLHCIQQLPEGAACIHVGIMLSRPTDGVRLVLNRIPTTQIVPYLKAIGWAHDTKELSSLLKELEKYTTRVVLHINVGKTIDSKIGLECSFSPDQFHLEEKWQSFFEYLTQKGLCLPEKKDAILQYPGMDSENLNDINFNSYMVATKIPGHSFSPALVRYISHVKITFQPGRPLDAKAYPGVRLFGHQQTIGNIETI